MSSGVIRSSPLKHLLLRLDGGLSPFVTLGDRAIVWHKFTVKGAPSRGVRSRPRSLELAQNHVGSNRDDARLSHAVKCGLRSHFTHIARRIHHEVHIVAFSPRLECRKGDTHAGPN